MKPTLPLLLLSTAFFVSCTNYQYMTVSGLNVPKNEKNELISENDTLRVEYRFTKEKGFVSARLYNKTNEPLEVEWRKSAVIINDKTVGYYDPMQTFNGEIESPDRRIFSVPGAPREVKGVLEGSEQLQFIPPHSYVESRPVAIPIHTLSTFPDEKAESLAFQFSSENTVKYKRLTYQPDNTPSKFRSYLTFRIGKAGAQQEFSVEHQFYISEIWKSHSGPGFFADAMDNRSDRFYLLQ